MKILCHIIHENIIACIIISTNDKYDENRVNTYEGISKLDYLPIVQQSQ